MNGLLVLVSCVVLGCGESPRDLGYGYYCVKLNRYDWVIVKKIHNDVFEPVAETNVVEYDVSDGVIFGLRLASEVLGDSEDLIIQKYGYFILDIDTGELLEGLSKAEYEKILDAEHTN